MSSVYIRLDKYRFSGRILVIGDRVVFGESRGGCRIREEDVIVVLYYVYELII